MDPVMDPCLGSINDAIQYLGPITGVIGPINLVQLIIPDEQPCFDLTLIITQLAFCSKRIGFYLAFCLTGGMCRIYLLFTFK